MSIRSDITQDSGWHFGEAKTLQITVTDAAGDPLNLSTLDLAWQVLRAQGSDTVYLLKTDSITTDGDDDEIAVIEIDPETDYEDLMAGIHYHELWDLSDSLLLAYGDVFLIPATVPVVPE